MNLSPPSTETGVVDSHAHVMKEYFKDEQKAVIERAFEHKVTQMVNPAVTVNDLEELQNLAKEYENIFFGLGQHPHDAKDWQADFEKTIEKASELEKMVAVGECGLDFYYENSSKIDQINVFRKQVNIAKNLKKPLIVHCRDAWQEALEILEEEKDSSLSGVFHCFTGNPQLMPRINELGFYVSYSGIVTFKNAKEIQDTVPMVPESRIMAETDCPFLAPQAMRGKRNEPSFVWWTVEKLAELQGKTIKEIALTCSKNARQLFNLPEPV